MTFLPAGNFSIIVLLTLHGLLLSATVYLAAVSSNSETSNPFTLKLLYVLFALPVTYFTVSTASSSFDLIFFSESAESNPGQFVSFVIFACYLLVMLLPYFYKGENRLLQYSRLAMLTVTGYTVMSMLLGVVSCLIIIAIDFVHKL